MSNPTTDLRLDRFETALNKLIQVACDWRLAWDGKGLHPETRLARARGAVMRAYKKDRK